MVVFYLVSFIIMTTRLNWNWKKFTFSL